MTRMRDLPLAFVGAGEMPADRQNGFSGDAFTLAAFILLDACVLALPRVRRNASLAGQNRQPPLDDGHEGDDTRDRHSKVLDGDPWQDRDVNSAVPYPGECIAIAHRTWS